MYVDLKRGGGVGQLDEQVSGSQIVELELFLVHGVLASVALLPVSHHVFHTATLCVAKSTVPVKVIIIV